MYGFFKYLFNTSTFTNTMVSPRLLDSYAYLYNALIGIGISKNDINETTFQNDCLGGRMEVLKCLNSNKLTTYINDSFNVQITKMDDGLTDLSNVEKTSINKAASEFNKFLRVWSSSTDDIQSLMLSCIMGYIYETQGDYSDGKTILNPNYLYIWNNIGNNIQYDPKNTPADYPYSLNYIPFADTKIKGNVMEKLGGSQEQYEYIQENTLCQGNVEKISKLCSDTEGCVGFSFKGDDGCADLFSSSIVDPGLINNNSNQNYLYSYYNLVQSGKGPSGSLGYSGILDGNPRNNNF